jgi:hypothetical protein
VSLNDTIHIHNDAHRDLTFREFQETNRRRCEEGFGHAVASDDPYCPLQDLALAIAGDARELCNLVKKCLRGDFTVAEKRTEILHELADVITYCDLAMSSLAADTGEVVAEKFNIISTRIDWALYVETAHTALKQFPGGAGVTNCDPGCKGPLSYDCPIPCHCKCHLREFPEVQG